MRTVLTKSDSWIKGLTPSVIEVEWHYSVYQDGSAAITVDEVLADEEEVFFRQVRVLMVESDFIEADESKDLSVVNFKIEVDAVEVVDEIASIYITYK